MHVVLINPYELGRQPFGLAQPAAWLQRAGCEVACIDLALEKLKPEVLQDADLVAIYLAMHTATRIAAAALPRIRELAPRAHLCVYGLYAPMNADFFHARGVATVLGGESEPAMVELIERLRHGASPPQTHVALPKIKFLPPARELLPPITRYAHLMLPDGTRKTVGFIEGTRGCKHLCRHCPVVPVYHGQFRVVPLDIVMGDVRTQVAAGAQHISFGDPDFFNGPTHAIKIVEAVHAEFPALSYDATIKIQHLLQHAELLPILKRTGCAFITAAVESIDDQVLEYLAKNHTAADFTRATQLVRDVGIALAPTFVPFNPWTTLESYLQLLVRIVALELVESVPAVQLTIRLLVPKGSYLLSLPAFSPYLQPFDENLLGHPWAHVDARVDALQRELQTAVAEGEAKNETRVQQFARVWDIAHRAAGRATPRLPTTLGMPIPRLSEPWYCCAEPTDQQLAQF